MGVETFYGCSGLININLPNLLSSNYGIFRNCTNLLFATFNKMKKVERFMFEECSKLRSVTM
jgi:hypothetical protein